MGSVYQCGGANIGITPNALRGNRAGVWRAASQFSPDLRATGRGLYCLRAHGSSRLVGQQLLSRVSRRLPNGGENISGYLFGLDLVFQIMAAYTLDKRQMPQDENTFRFRVTGGNRCHQIGIVQISNIQIGIIHQRVRVLDREPPCLV